MKIRAFRGLRPIPEKSADIASLPYDVVNFEQAVEQAKGKPLSFMRVVRSEIELPEGTDPYSDAVYLHAKENFKKLVDAGYMVREDAPCMYLYRQQMGNHSQTGLVATFSAEDYDNDVIKKHGIKKVYHGHIHGAGLNAAVKEYDGVQFKLISCDCVDFTPVFVV